MRADIDDFSGQIKRDLTERKFNLKDENCCRTGGRSNGCPFFRLSGTLGWMCTLYRLTPKFSTGTKRYKRPDACLKNKEPPIKRHYSIQYITRHTCGVTAISKEEAHEIFKNSHVGVVEDIKEGDIVEHENLI